MACWKMPGVAGDEVVRIGGLRAFEKPVIGFMRGNRERPSRRDEAPDLADFSERPVDEVRREMETVSRRRWAEAIGIGGRRLRPGCVKDHDILLF
jgi:hypothetical protein